MKSLINLRTGVMVLTLLLLSGVPARADVDDFILSVRNVTHTANTIEFDLYLLDDDDAQAFDFAALQMGLLLNSSIYGTGTLTVSYSNLGSGLDGDQQFVNDPDVVTTLEGYEGKTLIRLMANNIPPVPPGAGSGTVISTTGDGTLLAHFTITSLETFTPNSRAGLEFCSGAAVSPLYPTVVYSYIDGNSTALGVTPGVDAIVDGDPLLNPILPAVFNVTGGGDYCEGGAGLPVGLDGSEADATYTLYRDGLAQPSPVPGTGAAITFGNQTEGTYMVTGANVAGDSPMTGQAIISETPNNTVTLTSGAGTDDQNLCVNTPIATIIYATTGATGASVTGLPAGVNGSWSADVVTISGTPSESGTFNYTVTLTGGCGTVTANGTLTVNICTKTLNLTLYLEGLYNGSNGLVKAQDCEDGENSFDLFAGTIADTLTVELAMESEPYTSVYIQHGVPIDIDGTISLTSVPGALSGNYFIVIKHRNHIETWSRSTSFSGSIVGYDFTDALDKAWGDNMVQAGDIYCLYTGDTNQDQYVDVFDLFITFNLNKQSSFGYQVSDINADGFIDIFDLIRVFNNNKKGVGMNTPLAPL